MTIIRLILTLILTSQCFFLSTAEAKPTPAQLEQAQSAFDKALYGSTMKLVAATAKTDFAASLLEAKTVQAYDGGDPAGLYMRTAALAPSKSVAAMWKGYSLFMSRKYLPAQSELQMAIELDPKNAQAHALLGCCLFHLDDVDHGLTEFKKAQQLDSRANQFDEYLAMGYTAAGESKKAEAVFDKLVSQNPKSARIYILRADFFAQAGKFKQALADYDRALQLSPLSQYAYYRRARELFNQGLFEKSIPDAQKGATLENVEDFGSKSKRLLAYAYDKTGQYQKAINEMKPLVAYTAHERSLSGTAKLSLMQLIEDYEKIHDYKSAKSTVDIVCRIEPKSTEALAKRARIFSELKDDRNSLHDYNVLIASDPSNPEWYRARAKIFEKLGRPESAKVDLKRAKELDD